MSVVRKTDIDMDVWHTTDSEAADDVVPCSVSIQQVDLFFVVRKAASSPSVDQISNFLTIAQQQRYTHLSMCIHDTAEQLPSAAASIHTDHSENLEEA